MTLNAKIQDLNFISVELGVANTGFLLTTTEQPRSTSALMWPALKIGCKQEHAVYAPQQKVLRHYWTDLSCDKTKLKLNSLQIISHFVFIF